LPSVLDISAGRILDWLAGLCFRQQACRVLLKIVGVFTCRVLSLAVLAFRGDPAKGCRAT
jgi:uncharacterized membrane protein (Fun14 family)